MSIFKDLDIDDFESDENDSKNKSFKITYYYHTFKPEKIGFKSLDVDNVKFYRNMYGDTRYYLRKIYIWGSNTDTWLFRVINKNNELLYDERIPDSEIKNRIPIFLRKEVIKEFLDE